MIIKEIKINEIEEVIQGLYDNNFPCSEYTGELLKYSGDSRLQYHLPFNYLRLSDIREVNYDKFHNDIKDNIIALQTKQEEYENRLLDTYIKEEDATEEDAWDYYYEYLDKYTGYGCGIDVIICPDDNDITLAFQNELDTQYAVNWIWSVNIPIKSWDTIEKQLEEVIKKYLIK